MTFAKTLNRNPWGWFITLKASYNGVCPAIRYIDRSGEINGLELGYCRAKEQACFLMNQIPSEFTLTGLELRLARLHTPH